MDSLRIAMKRRTQDIKTRRNNVGTWNVLQSVFGESTSLEVIKAYLMLRALSTSIANTRNQEHTEAVELVEEQGSGMKKSRDVIYSTDEPGPGMTQIGCQLWNLGRHCRFNTVEDRSNLPCERCVPETDERIAPVTMVLPLHGHEEES